MYVDFADDDLRRLYTDLKYHAGYSGKIIRSFRQKVAFLVSAPDEMTLHRWKGLKYKQLKGKRKLEWSTRLNGAWRLILRRREIADGLTLVITGIEQNH